MLIYLNLLETDEEKEIFTEIYNHNYQAIYSMAFSILKHKEDSENAVHETFCRLADHFKKYAHLSPSEMTGLCISIVKNICIDMLRRQNRFTDREMEKLVKNDDGKHIDYLNMTALGQPEDLAEKRETAENLKILMEQLPDEQREVLLLRYALELRTKDIAQLLKLSVKTVDTRLARGKERMRKLLYEQEKQGN